MKINTSIFLVAILYGCGSAISPVDQGLIDQVMHIGNGSEPQGLDPHIVTGAPEHHLLITMCEGLTISNPEGGANLPGMAESWEISEDGKTYIFNIRKDAKWSNGDEFLAEDLKIPHAKIYSQIISFEKSRKYGENKKGFLMKI